MRRKTLAGGAGRRPWVLALALGAVLLCAVGAGAAPGTKEGAGKGNPAKEAAGNETPKAKAVELVIQVNDAAGKPVRGAAVSVVIGDLEIEQRSNGSGQATFHDLPVGAARVQAVATGWNSSGRVVTLTGDRVQVDLALIPRKPPSGGAAGGVHGAGTDQAPQGSAGTPSQDEKQAGGKVQAVDDTPAVPPSPQKAPDTQETTGGPGGHAAP